MVFRDQRPCSSLYRCEHGGIDDGRHRLPPTNNATFRRFPIGSDPPCRFRKKTIHCGIHSVRYLPRSGFGAEERNHEWIVRETPMFPPDTDPNCAPRKHPKSGIPEALALSCPRWGNNPKIRPYCTIPLGW